MVIAKPEWFKSKKGDFWKWDISWKGTIYTLIMIPSPFLISFILPKNIINTIIITSLILFWLIDFIPAVWKSFDERDTKIYGIAERTAFWSMIVVLSIVILALPIYILDQVYLSILVGLPLLVGSLTYIFTLAIQYKKESLNEK